MSRTKPEHGDMYVTDNGNFYVLSFEDPFNQYAIWGDLDVMRFEGDPKDFVHSGEYVGNVSKGLRNIRDKLREMM